MSYDNQVEWCSFDSRGTEPDVSHVSSRDVCACVHSTHISTKPAVCQALQKAGGSGVRQPSVVPVLEDLRVRKRTDIEKQRGDKVEKTTAIGDERVC